MKKAADRRKRNKNAGFSLVELLIAVVILAIIVIPLLHVFLSSNRINIKSRKTLRATTAAQDIMEGLKAYDINELKEQFADPASGFYVIDSRLIKGGVGVNGADASGTLVPVDDPAAVQGLYVFSMKDVSFQGSKFDARIVVDGRGYMSSTPAGEAMKDHDAHLVSPTGTETYKFNDAALADARSIDKKNGTFVEAEKYRQAVLKSVFKYSPMESAIKDALLASGVPAGNIDNEYLNTQDAVHFKNITTFFDKVSRIITIDLNNSAELDEDGKPLVDMVVTQVYHFTYKDLVNGVDVEMDTSGEMGSGVMVDALPCGKIKRMTDQTTGRDQINVNLFYYPLYGYSISFPDKVDEIVVNNASGADLNLLIAKQRHETADPSDPNKVDLSDPEYLSDAQLMAAEQDYAAKIKINDTYGFHPDQFTLKTNLGLNLVGEKYASASPGGSYELPSQLGSPVIGGTPLNQLNIFTLDGVRSPLGKAGGPGEATELIYDVEVGIYQEGAADDGFPPEKRMVVIGGSTTN